MNDITPHMPEKLLAYLNAGGPALLLSCGEDGYPTSAYSWAVALDAKRLRFGVDDGGSSYRNLQRSSKAGIHIIGPNDLAFLVKGTTTQLKDHIDAAGAARMALFEMQVMGARDQSFPGVTATPFTYEWPREQREVLQAMERAVYEEMRSYQT